MAFVDAIKYNRIRSMKGLPIGAIIPWASDQSTIPTGWILCNGATISNTRYPILFKIIGNAYGGTVGSTYKLPPLSGGLSSVVDMYRGHYRYLKDRNEDADKPVSTSRVNDAFWSIVGFGENGDTGNNSQTSWTSTIDLVGEERSTSVNFPGVYDNMTVTDGSYGFTVVWAGTSLGDEHIPAHTHGLDINEATSWSRASGSVAGCDSRQTWSDFSCRHDCDSDTVFRVAAAPESGPAGNVWRANVPDHLEANLNRTDNRTGIVGTGGGGNIRGVPRGSVVGGAGESGATVYEGGNGRREGSMGAYQHGDTLFTSRNNDNINDSAEHFHPPNNYELQGRYTVINPGLRDNISLNTVRINNSPGENFGTITANTATPSLEMIFIIRAF